MCEVTVLCGATVPPPRVAVPAEPPLIPTPGHYTVYHLQTRTFWSQIATIWEWFVANFSSESLAGRGHTRPVYVYTVDDGVWRPLRVIEGRLRLEPPLLELGEAHIDRVTRQWVAADSGEQLGYCRRLPLWDALAEIAAHSGPVGEVELTAPSPELPR